MRAQGIKPSAQIFGVAGPAAGEFSYNITLENAVSATIPVSELWFSWLPGGGNFLPSNPLTILAPEGWVVLVSHDGPHDGYGIQFTTSTAPVLPGASQAFSFISGDSPDALRTETPYDNRAYEVLASTAYAAHNANQVTFMVTYAPEPSTWALVAVGAGGLWLAGCRTGRGPLTR